MTSYATGSVAFDKELNKVISGGKSKDAESKEPLSDRYWAAVDSTTDAWLKANPMAGRATGSGDGSGRGIVDSESDYRSQRLQEDLSNTFFADAAKRAGIKQFNSENDIPQVWDYIYGGGKQQAAADPAKANQAVQAAVGWKDQNSGQGGSAAGGFGRPSGFVPGGRSYAADLAGDDVQRNSLYDNIASRGAGMVDSFRSIGRDYYMRANQEGKDIAQAGWDALNALSPDVQPTDYINPWTTPVGKKGETLVTLGKNLING